MVKKKILLLPGAYHSPAARFRIWQFVEPFKKAGYAVEVKVPFPDREDKTQSGKSVKLPARLRSVLRVISAWWLTRNANQYDAIIMNRDIIPELSVHFLEKRIINNGGKLIFDFDDAIHLGDRNKKLQTFLSQCNVLVAGNPMLLTYAKAQNEKSFLIPTVVDTDFYLPRQERTPGSIRIGWSGSASTNVHCLPLLKEPITALAKELDFEFIVISDEDPKIEWDGVRYTYIKWNAKDEVKQLQYFDIGLMPLKDSPFEQGKCGLKAIQYMALGIPALVSPVGVNAQIVQPENNGYHCVTADDWKNYMLMLSNNSHLRSELGAKARTWVVENYSVDSAMVQWNEILMSL